MNEAANLKPGDKTDSNAGNRVSNTVGNKEKSAARKEDVHALSPFEEMEKYFEHFAPRRWLRNIDWDWPRLSDLEKPFGGKLPRVDVVDRDNEILVRAEVAGVKKEDLDVSLTDHTMVIKGKTRHEEKEEKGEYFRSETTHGAFTRTVSLPSDVDGEKAKASYNDGLLEIVIPKLEKAQRRKVEVS